MKITSDDTARSSKQWSDSSWSRKQMFTMQLTAVRSVWLLILETWLRHRLCWGLSSRLWSSTVCFLAIPTDQRDFWQQELLEYSRKKVKPSKDANKLGNLFTISVSEILHHRITSFCQLLIWNLELKHEYVWNKKSFFHPFDKKTSAQQFSGMAPASSVEG